MQGLLLTELRNILNKGKQFYLKRLKDRYPLFNPALHKRVILFGAAEMGKIYLGLCKKNKLKVISVCDNDISKRGNTFGGVKIISVKELLIFSKKTPIIITSKYDEEIEYQLKKLGFINVWPHFYFSVIFPKKFNNPHWQSSLEAIFSNRNKIIKCYRMFLDKPSKYTFLNVLKYRLLFDRKFLREKYLPVEKEYFDHEIIKFGEDETYVDGGAYDGDTVGGFIKAVNNKFEKIHAFEPDRVLFNKLKKYINSLKTKKINIYQQGLGKIKEKLSFSNQGTPGSRITKNGQLIIQVVPLDLVVNKATFIKLDIEGAEIDALLGARVLLVKKQPKLAICVYHKPSDLWEIPFLIKKINPDYKLYLRHYGEFLYDTICYAL